MNVLYIEHNNSDHKINVKVPKIFIEKYGSVNGNYFERKESGKCNFYMYKFFFIKEQNTITKSKLYITTKSDVYEELNVTSM